MKVVKCMSKATFPFQVAKYQSTVLNFTMSAKVSNFRVKRERIIHTACITMHYEYTRVHTHIVFKFRNGQKSVVEYLVCLPQVDVSAKDIVGYTALHYASR